MGRVRALHVESMLRVGSALDFYHRFIMRTGAWAIDLSFRRFT
jgi:hypothetical protein